MIKLIKLLGLCGVLISGCSNNHEGSEKITGTVRSSFEHFAFLPIGSEKSYWISYDSYNATDWSIFNDIHQSLLKNEDELQNLGRLAPPIYICVSGVASTKHYDNGTGHMNAWESEITFTKISSAEIGQCKPEP